MSGGREITGVISSVISIYATGTLISVNYGDQAIKNDLLL